MKHLSLFAFILAFPFFLAHSAHAQARLTLDPGVEPHKGIDEIYKKFSKAYDDLDPAGVADLYTESAAYLSPGTVITIGRETILSNFTRTFDSVRSRKLKWKINFRIVQREAGENLGYDIGIYSLTATQEDGASRTDRGKFVVVTKKGKDGVWRFQVDGYSDMPKSEQ
ncbi:MAG TPA: SgcJ/EcaC family oxidoreductase [Aridibacter sp.]|nr:SgcJ/EcaC family oxidoreductase [Aridibacter sp.]